MTQQDNSKYIIDGNSLPDLSFDDTVSPQPRTMWAFLSQTMPKHPWVAGVGAIVAIAMFGKTPSVQMTAIVAITAIMIAQQLHWRSHGRSKKTRKSDDVR